MYCKSDGHPYIVQIFGERALQRKKNPTTITLQDAQDSVQLVLDDVWDWYADYCEGRIDSKEETILTALSELGGKATLTALAAEVEFAVGPVLATLEKRRWILRDEETREYYLPHKLVAECIKNSYLSRVT